jgi:hypothetical protein
MMTLVALLALVSALVVQSFRVARRDRELATIRVLLDDYQRAADRMEWAERMYKKGYVSKAQVDLERNGLKRAGFDLLVVSPSQPTAKGK